jgi:hypothetical protein
MGSALCGSPVGHSAFFTPKPNLLDARLSVRYCTGYNSRGGDWLRLRWLIQGKRAEDGGHNLVNTVTAKQ